MKLFKIAVAGDTCDPDKPFCVAEIEEFNEIKVEKQYLSRGNDASDYFFFCVSRLYV